MLNARATASLGIPSARYASIERISNSDRPRRLLSAPVRAAQTLRGGTQNPIQSSSVSRTPTVPNLAMCFSRRSGSGGWNRDRM